MSFIARSLVRSVCNRGHLSWKYGTISRTLVSSRLTDYKRNRFCTGASDRELQLHSKVLPVSNDIYSEDSYTSIQDSDGFNNNSSELELLPSQQQREFEVNLAKQIYSSTTVDEVLSIYREHLNVMTPTHLQGLMKQLRVLVEDGAASVKDIHEQDDFRSLCQQLVKISRRLEVDELLALLTCLSRLEVKSNSKIMLTMLQLLRYSMNDLSLHQITHLDFVLHKVSPSTLSEGLSLAIYVVLENQLMREPLDDLSLKHLSKILSICVNGGVKNIDVVLQEIYSRGSITSGHIGLSILWSLVQMFVAKKHRFKLTKEVILTREVLIKESLEAVARDLYQLTQAQIETTLEKLREAYEKRDRCTYNEHFLNEVANYVIVKQWDYTAMCHTVRKLLSMNFIPEELLDVIIDKIIKNPQEAKSARVALLPLLSALAGSELQHLNLHQALDIIMDHEQLQIKEELYFKRPWIRITLDLLSMNYYHEPTLKLVTNEDFLTVFMSKKSKNMGEYMALLRIHQALKTRKENSYIIPERFLEPGRNYIMEKPPSKSDLLIRLQQILQHPDHILSSVVIDNDLYIDHLLVVDKEGKTIHIETERQVGQKINMNSLEIPENSERIAVLDLGSSSVYGPGSRLRGPLRLHQEILEAEGFKVVHILQSELFQLLPDERTLFIQRKLQNMGVMCR